MPGLSLWLSLRATWSLSWVLLGLHLAQTRPSQAFQLLHQPCYHPWLPAVLPQGAASPCCALPQVFRIHLKEKDSGLCHASDLIGASLPCMGRCFREGFLLLVFAYNFSFSIGQAESLLENETEQVSMTQFCTELPK